MPIHNAAYFPSFSCLIVLCFPPHLTCPLMCYTGREAAARGGLDRGAAAYGEGAARSPTLHPTHHQGDHSHLHQSCHGAGFCRRGTVLAPSFYCPFAILGIRHYRSYLVLFYT
jgi:hypothetical protein